MLEIVTSFKNGHLSQRYVFLHSFFSNQCYYFLTTLFWHFLFLHVTLLFFVWHFFQHSFLCIFSYDLMLQFLHTTLLLNNLGYFLEKILVMPWTTTTKVSPNKMHLQVRFLDIYFQHIQPQIFFNELISIPCSWLK